MVQAKQRVHCRGSSSNGTILLGKGPYAASWVPKRSNCVYLPTCSLSPGNDCIAQAGWIASRGNRPVQRRYRFVVWLRAVDPPKPPPARLPRAQGDEPARRTVCQVSRPRRARVETPCAPRGRRGSLAGLRFSQFRQDPTRRSAERQRSRRYAGGKRDLGSGFQLVCEPENQ
jgi:hypothetical protein